MSAIRYDRLQRKASHAGAPLAGNGSPFTMGGRGTLRHMAVGSAVRSSSVLSERLG